MSKLSFIANCSALLFAASALAQPPTAFIEDFASDPAGSGWKTYGDATLFQWNTGLQNLDVTWDSSKPNSYFARPLGVTLTKNSSFRFEFELTLKDVQVGTTAGKPYTFQLAVGLLNLNQATAANFFRGSGMDSPNVVEFDYFPAGGGLDATVAPTIISSNMMFASSFNFPFELNTGDRYRIIMTFDDDDGELKTGMTRNGEPIGPVKTAVLGPDFTDFHVDHVAIMSYSDAGQFPDFAGSVLAHGTIDNVFVAPAIPAKLDMGLAGKFVGTEWHAEFNAQAGWTYALYRTQDFATESLVTTLKADASGRLVLRDTNPAAGHQFYRVLASRP